MVHLPVLLNEVLHYLDVGPNENFIDATAGAGGHSFAILERCAPHGKVLALERDPELVKFLEQEKLRRKVGERLTVRTGNFRDLKVIAADIGLVSAAGILFDLGLSSWHLGSSGRGFSFLRDEPLDMRFNPQEQSRGARDIISTLPEDELAKIFRTFGDEPKAFEIARAVAQARRRKPLETTKELVGIIERSVRSGRQRIHPATRVFQALRIAVNDELENLRLALPQARQLLRPGGRLVIIAFHSGEDRIVKRFLQSEKTTLGILTPKPIRASREEITKNFRARSAKLRAAQKL